MRMKRRDLRRHLKCSRSATAARRRQSQLLGLRRRALGGCYTPPPDRPPARMQELRGARHSTAGSVPVTAAGIGPAQRRPDVSDSTRRVRGVPPPVHPRRQETVRFQGRSSPGGSVLRRGRPPASRTLNRLWRTNAQQRSDRPHGPLRCRRTLTIPGWGRRAEAWSSPCTSAGADRRSPTT